MEGHRKPRRPASIPLIRATGAPERRLQRFVKGERKTNADLLQFSRGAPSTPPFCSPFPQVTASLRLGYSKGCPKTAANRRLFAERRLCGCGTTFLVRQIGVCLRGRRLRACETTFVQRQIAVRFSAGRHSRPHELLAPADAGTEPFLRENVIAAAPNASASWTGLCERTSLSPQTTRAAQCKGWRLYQSAQAPSPQTARGPAPHGPRATSRMATLRAQEYRRPRATPHQADEAGRPRKARARPAPPLCHTCCRQPRPRSRIPFSLKRCPTPWRP